MFKEERDKSHFEWTMLGNISEGRPNLGEYVTVDVYRLMQFTLRDSMIQRNGVAVTDEIFYDAGKKAGLEFFNNLIGKSETFNEFVEKTQERLKDLRIGVLRVEKADHELQRFTLTVSEDLDCSGLPITNEEICVYDEGFIAGLLLGQTDMNFEVKEVDCWCSGDRVCRFDIKPTEEYSD